MSDGMLCGILIGAGAFCFMVTLIMNRDVKPKPPESNRLDLMKEKNHWLENGGRFKALIFNFSGGGNGYTRIVKTIKKEPGDIVLRRQSDTDFQCDVCKEIVPVMSSDDVGGAAKDHARTHA